MIANKYRFTIEELGNITWHSAGNIKIHQRVVSTGEAILILESLAGTVSMLVSAIRKDLAINGFHGNRKSTDIMKQGE
jgi:hypothetical protein